MGLFELTKGVEMANLRQRGLRLPIIGYHFLWNRESGKVPRQYFCDYAHDWNRKFL